MMIVCILSRPKWMKFLLKINIICNGDGDEDANTFLFGIYSTHPYSFIALLSLIFFFISFVKIIMAALNGRQLNQQKKINAKQNLSIFDGRYGIFRTKCDLFFYGWIFCFTILFNESAFNEWRNGASYQRTKVRDSNSKWRSPILNKAQALSVYNVTNANKIQPSPCFFFIGYTELLNTTTTN